MATKIVKVKGVKKVVQVDDMVEVVVPKEKVGDLSGSVGSKGDGAVSKKENPACFLVLFKIEGHETYRTAIWKKPADFDAYLKQPGQVNHPVPTERKWFIIDKITGTIKEV